MATGLCAARVSSSTVAAVFYGPLERCKIFHGGFVSSSQSVRRTDVSGNGVNGRLTRKGGLQSVKGREYNPGFFDIRRKRMSVRRDTTAVVVRAQGMASEWHFDDNFMSRRPSLCGSSKVEEGNKLGFVGETACNAMGKALSSMVYMIKTLQSYALHMDNVLYDRHIPSMISAVQREMSAAFVWLFQQVFACTPVLMVAVMLLFADFTVYSVAEHVNPLRVSTSISQNPNDQMFLPSPSRGLECEEECQSFGSYEKTQFANKSGQFGQMNSAQFEQSGKSVQVNESAGELLDMAGCGGRGSRHCWSGAEPDEGNNGRQGWVQGTALLRGRDSSASRIGPEASQSSSVGRPSVSMKVSSSSGLALIDDPLLGDISAGGREGGVGREPGRVSFGPEGERTDSGGPSGYENEGRERDRSLNLNPVAQLSEDTANDALALEFNWTEEHYEDLLSREPRNALLLANYAQFRHVVRHDASGAESLFKRALAADSTDGHILDRFASFLWLERGNKRAAELAYRAAIACDPSNPYYSGSYAHFLWHSGGED